MLHCDVPAEVLIKRMWCTRRSALVLRLIGPSLPRKPPEFVRHSHLKDSATYQSRTEILPFAPPFKGSSYFGPQTRLKGKGAPNTLRRCAIGSFCFLLLLLCRTIGIWFLPDRRIALHVHLQARIISSLRAFAPSPPMLVSPLQGPSTLRP